MKAGFEGVFNEPLCIKFGSELIEMVARVKANREAARHNVEQGLGAEDIQYFIHTAGIKEFLKALDGNIRLFLGLSVRQFYHEGAHAASQVACLQNLREGYEQLLQDHITRKRVKVDPVKRTLPVDLIVADVNPALDKIPAVEIDLMRQGQCIQLLNDPRLEEFEESFVKKGDELEAVYRALFSTEEAHQKDVEINFKLADTPTRWRDLKRYYQDPLFIEMVNYLEACFKFAVQKLTEDGRKKGLCENWASVVKVNDLAYVIGEIVLLQYKIFNFDALGEELKLFLMYRGPFNMILGSGKNILAERFRDYLTKLNCGYLRSEQLGFCEGKQDKNAALFLGKLNAQGARILPSVTERRNRLDFIAAEIDEAKALEITLDALQSRLKRQEAKAARESKRRRDHFDTSPYAQFLDAFSSEFAQYSSLIRQMVSARELTWDAEDPIKAMICTVSTLVTADENSDSPRVRRARSLTGSREGFCLGHADQLKLHLEKLHSKFCSNSSAVKRLSYCRRAACYLVECAVAVQKSVDTESLQLKRTKSISAEGGNGLLTQSYEKLLDNPTVVPVAIIRPSHQERLIVGLLFFIHQITENPQIPLSALKDPDYYPDNTPRIDYVSTQESQSSSVPASGSLGQ